MADNNDNHNNMEAVAATSNHSANPLAPIEPVEAQSNMIDSLPLAADMNTLSLAASATSSTQSSAQDACAEAENGHGSSWSLSPVVGWSLEHCSDGSTSFNTTVLPRVSAPYTSNSRLDEDEISTFHGHIPRHPRPEGIGLGHLGYDSVYTRARDGLPYTSVDVPNRAWTQDINAPLVFVSESTGKRTVVDYDIGEDNPVLIEAGENLRDARPLYDILAEEEAANAQPSSQTAQPEENGGLE